MLKASDRLAIYMEGASDADIGKMGHGILRYSPQEIVCVIDSEKVGQNMINLGKSPRPSPIVATIEEAHNLGANVLVLGIAPPGGLIPAEWLTDLDRAIASGFSLVNGLHDLLAPRYRSLQEGQWIWDVRVEPDGLGTASAQASKLPNKRILMLGTDMAIGKMTAGLELWRGLQSKGKKAGFVATGQIGITITGSGVPLDAIRVDYAAGAIEREVVLQAENDYIIIEGQGSLIHPASTSPLPLMRGSCPTHIIMCHRAGQTTLRRHPHITLPPLSNFISLCEDVAECCGTYARPRTLGIALNTAHLNEEEARAAVHSCMSDCGYPCTDPVRFGVDGLLDALDRN